MKTRGEVMGAQDACELSALSSGCFTFGAFCAIGEWAPELVCGKLK